MFTIGWPALIYTNHEDNIKIRNKTLDCQRKCPEHPVRIDNYGDGKCVCNMAEFYR